MLEETMHAHAAVEKNIKNAVWTTDRNFWGDFNSPYCTMNSLYFHSQAVKTVLSKSQNFLRIGKCFLYNKYTEKHKTLCYNTSDKIGLQYNMLHNASLFLYIKKTG